MGLGEDTLGAVEISYLEPHEAYDIPKFCQYDRDSIMYDCYNFQIIVKTT